MGKIKIITGLNAAGKSKEFDELDKEEFVKISSKDISNNISDFNYKSKEKSEIEEEINETIDSQIKEQLIKELGDYFKEEDFENQFKKKYKDKISIDSLFSAFKNDEDKLKHGYLTFSGLLNLDTNFQDLLQNIDKTKMNSDTVKASLKYAIAKRMNTWNNKWKESYEMVGGDFKEDYEVASSGIEELDHFFDKFSQKDLQNAKYLDFKDVQYWTANWDEQIIYSIWTQVKTPNLIKSFKKLEELREMKIKNEEKYFNNFKAMINKTNIKNIKFGDNFKIQKTSELSNGQIGMLLSAQMAAEADAEEKSLALDDVTEVFDNGIKSMIIDFLVNKTNIKGDIYIYTHLPIDIRIVNKGVNKIEHFWISENDNEKYIGSPVLYNTLSKLKGLSTNIDYIILITARIMNRQIANFSKYYHSNKKINSDNHGTILWNFISEFSKNIEIKNPDKYFGEARKWINSKISNRFKFNDLVNLILVELKKEEDLNKKRLGVSLKFLEDFWKAMLDKGTEKDNSDKYLHFLDFMTSI